MMIYPAIRGDYAIEGQAGLGIRGALVLFGVSVFLS